MENRRDKTAGHAGGVSTANGAASAATKQRLISWVSFRAATPGLTVVGNDPSFVHKTSVRVLDDGRVFIGATSIASDPQACIVATQNHSFQFFCVGVYRMIMHVPSADDWNVLHGALKKLGFNVVVIGGSNPSNAASSSAAGAPATSTGTSGVADSSSGAAPSKIAQKAKRDEPTSAISLARSQNRTSSTSQDLEENPPPDASNVHHGNLGALVAEDPLSQPKRKPRRTREVDSLRSGTTSGPKQLPKLAAASDAVARALVEGASLPTRVRSGDESAASAVPPLCMTRREDGLPLRALRDAEPGETVTICIDGLMEAFGPAVECYDAYDEIGIQRSVPWENVKSEAGQGQLVERIATHASEAIGRLPCVKKSYYDGTKTFFCFGHGVKKKGVVTTLHETGIAVGTGPIPEDPLPEPQRSLR
ncbi:hypothetical protein DFJ74DRAFT_758822 [Hyaloraphidium curvatum]|nr:hypothetical protein DFJ74DRAFT_758822 [Hyaloraphidium curvatum]